MISVFITFYKLFLFGDSLYTARISRRMMVMRIQHNIRAMNADRQVGITEGILGKSAEKLSSGYKVNRAADDAAGLSISEKMRRQVRGLTQASANSEDGISMIQIADGALTEVHDMIDRCLELSVQASNGTNSASDREKIQDEISQIITEIDAIKDKTKFNEIYVLKGIGVYAPDRIERSLFPVGSLPDWVDCPAIRYENEVDGKTVLFEEYTDSQGDRHVASSMDFSAFSANNKQDLYGKGFSTTCCTCNNFYCVEFTSGTGAQAPVVSGNSFVYKLGIDDIHTASDLIDAILDLTKDGNGNLGHPAGHFTQLEKDPANSNKLWVYDNRPGTPYNTKMDWGLFAAGVMYEMEKLIPGSHEEPQQVALQVGADTGNQMILKMATISSHALGIDNIDVRGGFVYDRQVVRTSTGERRRLTVEVSGADQAIKAFGKAKDIVSAERSRLGAYQNRLEHTVKNLDNVVENTAASESRIRDTDMAEEMVLYSNHNILLQSGQAMLAQANQSEQGILSLLAG